MNLLKKLEKSFLYFFVFAFSWQTRIVLWQKGYVFNEWQSIFLYLSDLLVLGLLAFWQFRFFYKEDRTKVADLRLEIILGIFWLLAGTSVFLAQDRTLGFYAFLKITEFLLVFFYFKHNVGRFNKERLFFIFILGTTFQAVLAIGQFLKQSSFGFKWLGEAPLAPEIAGVAKIDFWGEKVIRGYGSLPHPNVLAAFLFAALLGFVFYVFHKNAGHWIVFWQATFFGIIFLGLLATFSRLAIVVTFVCLLIFFARKFFKEKQTKPVLSFLFLLVVFSSLVLGLTGELLQERFNPEYLSDEQSVDLRVYYNRLGWEFFKQRPLGVGVGNFVSSFILKIQRLGIEFNDWVFQPIHNLYLLIMVELGFLGIILFLWFLSEVARRIYSRKREDNFYLLGGLIFAGFLVLGFFDHYFWTLQQGQLLFWGTLGIIAGCRNTAAKNETFRL